MVAVVAAILVALLAAAVNRRLHDRDRRGYWGLIPLPFLAAGMALMPEMSTNIALIANFLAYLYGLALLVYFLVGKGTPGPNRFGPPPG
jgi:uncharacterized membrane protein YhaH (DUF805 family)